MDRFSDKGELYEKDRSGIMRDSLPSNWVNVVLTIMAFFTLDAKITMVRSFHLAFLNHLRGKKSMNVPAYLFRELERSMLEAKANKTFVPSYQGLIFILYKFIVLKRNLRELITCEITKRWVSIDFDVVGDDGEDKSEDELEILPSSGPQQDEDDDGLPAYLHVKVVHGEIPISPKEDLGIQQSRGAFGR